MILSHNDSAEKPANWVVNTKMWVNILLQQIIVFFYVWNFWHSGKFFLQTIPAKHVWVLCFYMCLEIAGWSTQLRSKRGQRTDHNRVNRSNPSAGQHGHHQLHHHGHVNRYTVTFLHACTVQEEDIVLIHNINVKSLTCCWSLLYQQFKAFVFYPVTWGHWQTCRLAEAVLCRSLSSHLQVHYLPCPKQCPEIWHSWATVIIQFTQRY